MAGIIKNQILKHLSRFVKNLSSDKISLSTLKGEGELTNLELDESVLTDLLALPTWMKLTHAHCNKAAIRIPWTKLKSTPILLALDSVTIRVEACEKLRQGAPPAPPNSFPTSAGKYGFVNKVIDGITATINTVEISFHSQAFESTVQINRIRLESQSPNWKKAELSHTRLKCMDRGETLIFKAMEWQTLRLEARSTSDRNLAPLRLLTNQARAHIVIKKKLADCQVLGCRLTLLLDDLLWVLTDSQILAALHFMNSLSGLIKESTETTQRFKAARKLESLPEYQAQLSQTAVKRDLRSESAKIFDHFDVKETSYHFLCEKIDLHFCDDPGGGRSRHEDLKEGGAFQVSLNQVLVDFYPYHLAKGERRSWKRYTADNALHQWLERSLNSFRIALIEAISSSSMHSPLTRTQQNNPLSPSGDANPVKKAVSDQLGKLMSTCLILKVQDLRLHKVTTSSKANVPQPFLSSYIDRPRDLQTIHMEFTWFYCPGEICFPLPSPKIFAHFYPFQLHLDVCTILWLNCFVTNLQNAMSSQTPVAAEPDYADVRIEILMPKIVFENNKFYASQKDRPQSLHMQVSRLVVSNFRSNETGSLHELTQCLETLQRGDLAYGSDFPSKPSDIPLIPEKFIMHAEGRDKVRTPTKFKGSSFQEIAPYLTKDMLNTEPRDVWYIFADPFWADFRVEGKRKGHSGKGKIQHENSVVSEEPPPSTIHPFIDSLPLQAWVYMTEEEEPESSDKSSEKKLPGKKSIKALFSANGICNVQLNHYQYLFLMRMIEALSELSLYLTYDLEQILGLRTFENLFTVLGVAPNVEVSLVFPPVMPPPPAGGRKFDSPNLDLDATEMLESPSEEMDEKESDRGPVWKMMEVNPKVRDLKPTVLVTDNLHVPRGSFSVSSSPVNSSIPSMESLRAGFAQVKQHGFQSLVSLNKVGGLSTPDSEIASQWSNLSDESDENAVPFETLDEDFVSKGNDVEEAVEVATEVLEDNRSTPSPTAFAFTSSSRANRPENDSLVGVLTLNLENVELAQEVNGLKTEMKFQCRSLALKECTSMAWNEFQAGGGEPQETKFATRNREWASETNNSLLNLGSPTQKRVVKVRVSQNIDVNKFKELLGSEETRSKMKSLKTVACPRINLTDRPGADSPLRGVIIDSTDASLCGKIDLRNEPPMTLHMSSVMSLTDFLEDEILPSPFPIKVEVMGVNIELIEDRPAANITSPGPVPIRVSVPQLPVSRDKDGVFYVGTLEGGHVNGDSSEKGFHATTTDQKNRKEAQIPDPDLVADFEKLQRQVQVMHTRNSELENELQNTQSLKLMVLELQEQVEKLQREKSDLLTYLNHR